MIFLVDYDNSTSWLWESLRGKKELAVASSCWQVQVITKMAVAVSLPASRAKLTMLNTMSKIRGQVKNPGYPQSEGLLGESMIRYGKELGEDSNFGECPVGLLHPGACR